MISFESLSQINKIIEQDKISSTYKFALLKNTIDVCQRYNHLIQTEGKHVNLPLGLIIEGWIFDYFPFVFNGIRQQNSGRVLNKQIESIYAELFEYMKLDPEKTTWQDSYAKVYMKYLSMELDSVQSSLLVKLSKEIAKTITKMPMKYSGENEYEIYLPEYTTFARIPKTETFNKEFLIENFGIFSIKKDHYHIFRYMGQSLYGNSTIARRWKETTYKLNQSNFATDKIDAMIYKTIFSDRKTNIGRKYLPDECQCVWSGKKLHRGKYDIDHILPYSVWFNNDLWNLLPCDPTVNGKKSDKIPSPILIKKQRNLIISY
ncbi:MAG: hypothetical protein KJO45_02040 [Sulfurovum sp.]|nr:hypothetical protein [Sulfurovum sp.]